MLNSYVYVCPVLICKWPTATLLNSHSLVAVGMWVVLRHDLQVAVSAAVWWVDSNIDSGTPQLWCIVGSRDKWEFPTFFRGHWQSPCTALMAGICLPLVLCKETVKESNQQPSIRYIMKAMVSQTLTGKAAKFVPVFHPDILRQWKLRVVTMPTFSSLVAQQVVFMTTSCASSYNKDSILKTPGFRWLLMVVYLAQSKKIIKRCTIRSPLKWLTPV